ncbi:MAG: saccharopine dehydrogenase NADP-binding domain-containing protein [Thermoanaerobaculia bacterium]
MSTAKKRLLVYGANGYTGRLILDAALERGLAVTVAGRRREAIEPLATERGLPFEVFALDEAPRRLAERVSPFGAVLLAAGPFSRTSAPVLAACLKARVAYLDITGEIGVFEAVFARHAEAVKAGVVLLPGVGFDVVPSDCLAASLAAALPGAVRLLLAFRGFGVSAGTARTMLEGLPKGGAARVDGKLVPVPAGWKTRTIPFPDRPRLAVTIPWGDLSTAYRSTGIPNIETYMAMAPSHVSALRWARPLLPMAAFGPFQSLLAAWVKRGVSGPSAEERARERSLLWGRVEDGEGRAVEGTLETLEGYSLTAETAVAAAERVLRGSVKAGAWTPSRAFGPLFVETVRDTKMTLPAPADGAGPPRKAGARKG